MEKGKLNSPGAGQVVRGSATRNGKSMKPALADGSDPVREEWETHPGASILQSLLHPGLPHTLCYF